MDISFRQAKTSDISILREINYTSFVDNKDFDRYIDINWAKRDIAQAYFEKALTAKDHMVTVAMVENRIAGYIVLAPKVFSYRTVKVIEIDNLAVLPEYRSHGVGTALVAHAKNWAKKQGYDTIYVNAYILNERAVAFYKAQGLMPIDVSLETSL